MAVKVTEVPAHMAPAGTAAMVTPALSNGFTVMVIPVEVTGDPVRQGVAFEVI